MKDPPRNCAGKITPHDHQDILDNDWFLRRVENGGMTKDEREHRWRISTGYFDESKDEIGGVSGELERLLKEAEITPEKRFESAPGIIKLSVGFLRNLGLQVGWVPINKDEEYGPNPFHCMFWNVTKAKKKQIIRNVEWIREHPYLKIIF